MSKFRCSRKKRIAVLERDGMKCVYCQTPLSIEIVNLEMREDGYFYGSCPEGFQWMTIDHILPYSRGGNHDISNLAACCLSCNSRKGTKTPDEWAKAKKAKAVN